MVSGEIVAMLGQPRNDYEVQVRPDQSTTENEVRIRKYFRIDL